MNIEPKAADVHIDLGQIHMAFTFEIDGKPYALTSSMSIADAERAATENVEPAFSIVKL